MKRECLRCGRGGANVKSFWFTPTEEREPCYQFALCGFCLERIGLENVGAYMMRHAKLNESGLTWEPGFTFEKDKAIGKIQCLEGEAGELVVGSPYKTINI